MRNFILTVLDSDGAEHEYRVKAKNAYVVTRHARRIALKYGHKVKDAINVGVVELIEDADMSNAIELK